MENKKPENPNAFAMCDEQGFTQYGMTLRDYFAAKAMNGLCVSALSNGLMTHQIVEMSFKIADTMLKQREL